MDTLIRSFRAATPFLGRAVARDIIGQRLERGIQPRRQPLIELAEDIRRGALARLGYTLPAEEIAAILRPHLRKPILTPWFTVRLVNDGQTVLVRPAFPIIRLVMAQEIARMLPDHPGIGELAEALAAKGPKGVTRGCWRERIARWLKTPVPLPDGRAIGLQRHPGTQGTRRHRVVAIYPDLSSVGPDPEGFRQSVRLPFVPSPGTVIPWDATLWRLIAVEPYTTTKGRPSNVLIWHRIDSTADRPAFRTTGLAFSRLNYIQAPYDEIARKAAFQNCRHAGR